MFKTCIERDFARPDSTVMGLASTVSTICYALSILEDKPTSGRNRRIAVKPNHSLLRVFAINLQKLLDHSAEHEPRSVLKNAVTLALALSNDILARKFHESLRKQFQQRAAANPSDGAEALKLLVEYLDFNESNDEAYLSLLCQETFDLLIPILESISPGDAAAARLGTGRNPYAAFG
ncbi:hypothetical protein LP420_36430 [Massilia sp. B-10]|nr:hypothetical protein LP420_36430 [Massilia sp. B-10]UUZ53897.1 hypothetical protein LP419_35875 [Massilia sp. H-1]